MRVKITGHPLTEPLILPVENWYDKPATDDIMIAHESADKLLDAWSDAPAEDDVVRSWGWFDAGDLFVTALTMEGSTDLTSWYEDEGLFRLDDMPFDLEVEVIP